MNIEKRLKELSLTDAAKLYELGSQDLYILRYNDKSGKMILYSFDDIFKHSRILYDAVITQSQNINVDKEILSKSNTPSTKSKEELIDSIPIESANISEIDYGTKISSRKHIDIGKIHALKNAGWSVPKIAEELKCSNATIYKYLKG